MSFTNMCSWVTPYVSTPEWICPPPAPTMGEYLSETVLKHSPLLAAGVGYAVVMLRPALEGRAVRLLAHSALLCLSVASLAQAAFDQSVVEVAPQTAIGLSGLVLGSLFLRRELRPQSGNGVHAIDSIEAHFLDEAQKIMNTPITEAMTYADAKSLMAEKSWALHKLNKNGHINLETMDSGAKQMLEKAFNDLEVFLPIYWKEVATRMQAIELTIGNTGNIKKQKAIELSNNDQKGGLYGPFFFPDKFYTMAKYGASRRDQTACRFNEDQHSPFYQEGSPEYRWRQIYNSHCQKFADLGISEEMERVDLGLLAIAKEDKPN